MNNNESFAERPTEEQLAKARDAIAAMNITEEQKQEIMSIVERGDAVFYDDEYDYCYETGNYSDQYCGICPHRYECSGYEDRD